MSCLFVLFWSKVNFCWLTKQVFTGVLFTNFGKQAGTKAVMYDERPKMKRKGLLFCWVSHGMFLEWRNTTKSLSNIWQYILWKDMKNVVKCWKDLLCYFPTLETYRDLFIFGGLSYVTALLKAFVVRCGFSQQTVFIYTFSINETRLDSENFHSNSTLLCTINPIS